MAFFFADWEFDILGEVDATDTTVTVPSLDGLTSLVINGAGFTYHPLTGMPTGGTITSIQHVVNDGGGVLVTITDIAVDMAGLGALLGDIFGLREDITWFNIIDANSSPIIFTDTLIRITNTNGTFTDFNGTGFGGEPPQLTGTVTSITHMQSDGSTVITTISDVNLSLQLAASALYDDMANQTVLYYLNTGDNTITSNGDVVVGADTYFPELLGGPGDDTYNGPSSGGNLTYEDYATAGVIVDLVAGTAVSGDDTDTLINITSVSGSNYADILSGNASDNFLQGNGGDDILFGAGGNDTLDGGFGANQIDGGDGVDTVEFDDSQIETGVVVSLAIGGVQNTIGSGTIQLTNIEDLQGSVLNDTLTGNAGANNIRGIEGDDTIVGADGADTLEGGEGADTLTGGSGVDFIIGGNGNDIINYNFGDGVDSAIQGGGGTDRIVCQGNSGGETLDAFWNGTSFTFFKGSSVSSIEQATADMGGGTDWLRQHNSTLAIAINLGAGTATGFTSIANIENAWGSAFNDTLTGSGVANTLRGANGDDQLDGAGGNDTLIGEDGLDTLSGGDGADTLYGLGGVDTINAGADNDTIYYSFGEGIDVIDGGDGVDTIICQGNSGAETLEVAWDGSAFTFFKGGAVTSIEQAQANMGVGGDWLRYTNSTASIAIDLGANTATGFTLLASVENAAGGTTDDTITGSGIANNLLGNGGADTINGAGGNDTINGGAGADTIIGGAGSDTMIGGADADTFVFATGSGVDTIVDFDANPTGGQDLLDISGYGISSGDFGARVTIQDLGANTLITIDGTNTIVLSGVTGDGNNVVTQADFILSA